MENINKPFEKTLIYKNIRGFFNLILIQSFAAALWMLLIPKEPENAIFLGYSIRRLLLLIPIILPAFVVLFVNYKRKKSETWKKWLEKEGNKAKLSMALILGGVLSALLQKSFCFQKIRNRNC